MNRLTNKSILLISPEPWTHVFVSKHHYAVYLAKRKNKVFFLNPPTSEYAVDKTEYPDLYSVYYPGFIPGLRFLPDFLQRMITRRVINRLEKLCNTTFEIVWSFDNSVFYDFRAFRSGTISISHIVDLNQDFQTASAAMTAQYCFCTTDYIQQKLQQYNRNVLKINHGFNEVETIKQLKIPGKQKIKAMYSGNLGMPYIDWQVLDSIVTLCPFVDFVFIGPSANTPAPDSTQEKAKRKVLGEPNVFCVGKISSNDLPSYFYNADILLVAYQEKYHKDQANPHKIMEYLGSGKTVVASFTYEYKNVSELVIMASTNDELPALFSRVVNNISDYNNESAQQKRRTFARSNSYMRHIEAIERYISSSSL